MDHDRYPDAYIRAILTSVKTVALVGASSNPARPSWIVTKYLSERGYDVSRSNPGLAGQRDPQPARLRPAFRHPRPIDMVKIFRNWRSPARSPTRRWRSGRRRR